ncbi:MAG: hypothetical protein U0271_25750 [Polyangiaceae bacterium]
MELDLPPYLQRANDDPPPPAPRGRERALRLALLCALPAVALFELGAGCWSRSRAPEPADYALLEPAMAELYKPGDLVVVAPRWAEPYARASVPDARVFTLETLGRSDAGTYARAIEISALGAHAPELSQFREVERRSVGPFELRVLENPAPEHVLFDFVENLEPRWASAFGTTGGPGGGGTRCTWSERARPAAGGLGGHPGFPARRFVCPEGFYLNVSATVIADEEFLPRRCIYAHPTEQGERVVRFDKVPLGDKIVGHAGLYWMIERAQLGAPIRLEVRVDGDVVGALIHTDGEGWRRFEFPLGGHAGAEASVEFAVSSTDYRDRHFCFQADTR